ncbi:hypothetical protein [Borrelia persica]|uniref:hypothetical protein n=1 Tax=Borrelia persica TaxID=44448 RepID=UPI0004634868|nr:hypothetical protein [Borrelia persica]
MKRMYAIIFILSLLELVGCKPGEPGSVGFMGYSGKDGIRGLDGRSDIDLFNFHYLKLKKMYFLNFESFKEKKDIFNKDIPFDNAAFNNKFTTDEQKDIIYASLNYDLEVIEIFRDIMNILVKDDSDDKKMRIRNFLFALRDSKQYVLEVMTEIGGIVGDDFRIVGDDFLDDSSLVSLKRKDNMKIIDELNAMLRELLYKRSNVIKNIGDIMSSTKPFLEVLSSSSLRRIETDLDSIGLAGGKVYEKIYTGEESLLGLKNGIMDKLRILKAML